MKLDHNPIARASMKTSIIGLLVGLMGIPATIANAQIATAPRPQSQSSQVSTEGHPQGGQQRQMPAGSSQTSTGSMTGKMQGMEDGDMPGMRASTPRSAPMQGMDSSARPSTTAAPQSSRQIAEPTQKMDHSQMPGMTSAAPGVAPMQGMNEGAMPGTAAMTRATGEPSGSMPDMNHGAMSGVPAGGMSLGSMLKTSSPLEGEVVQSAPSAISLTFAHPMRLHSLTLSSVGGETLPVSVDGMPMAETVSVRLPPLKPGDYEADWRAIGDGGHSTTGVVSFTIL